MPITPTPQVLAENGGEMALRTRATDWASTAVGDSARWPPVLQAIVKMMLHAKFPMFVIWGEQYTCFYNDGYVPMLGARHPAALGMPLAQVWPEIWDDIHPLIVRAYHGDATRSQDMPLLMLRNGVPERAYFTFSYSPLFADNGEIEGMLCVCNETTREVELEQQRRVAVAELASLNETLEQRIAGRSAELEHVHEQLRQSQKLEAIGNLTGGVAHDFNNALQVIGGNLQLMRKDTRDNAYLHSRLNAAMAGVERGAKLSSQLLSFARRQPLEPVVLNSGRLMRNIDEMLRRAVGETIALEIVVAAGLWNVLVDRSRLENALLNLVINARDAMQGSGRLTIESSNASLDDAYARLHPDVGPGQYVLIAVSDTGCGMSPATLSRIFEPFFTTKPEGHGTGLGLAMVYGFVKQSGGHIKVYSEPGHGTTVKIYLPRSRETEAVLPSAFSGPVVGGQETILVVEDDAQVRDTVVALLLDLGYRVFKSPDAASALAVLQSGVPVDLLFTDVIMPGELKSPELARQAATIQPGIEVLFTSGYTETGIVHHGRLAPGVALLTKPYRREDLARKIREMFAERAGRNNPDYQADRTAGSGSAGGAGGDQSVARGPLAILVVEDNAQALQISAAFLEQAGHHVSTAASAEEALVLLAAERFDLLVTDVTLPQMSGLQLARLATHGGVLQVAFASGHPPTPDLPADTLWLQKPFGYEQLQQLLAEVLRRKVGRDRQ